MKFELVHGPAGRALGGLAWDGKEMLVSDINDSTTLAFDPETGKTRVQRRWTNRMNGIAWGADGALYGCQMASRRVVRMPADGSMIVTTTKLHGHNHNQPNLVVADKKGRIWFTDVLDPLPASGPAVFPYLEHQSVLRMEQSPRPQSHWHIERITFDTQSARGLALSPDEKTLYVSETDNEPGGVRELRAYPVLEDGTLGPYRLFHSFGADSRGVHRGIEGLCVDAGGNLLACAGWTRSGPGPLLYVFAPSGQILESHAVPEGRPVNCAFGDRDLSTLYVTTAAGHLFRAKATGRKGHLPHLPQR
jgi:gluconolactonase